MTVLGILLALLATPAAAQEPSVLFNEIAWAGSTSSANDEWIELYNPTAREVDVTGYKIVAADGSPAITLKGMVLPGGYFLLERTDDSTTPALADMLYTGSLSNEGETLRLYAPDGRVLDEVAGWSGGDNGTKTTMARNGAEWTSGIANGTPGATNTFTPASEQTNQASARASSAPISTEDSEEEANTPVTAAAPVAAANTPLTLRGEEQNVPLWAGLGAAFVLAGGAALFFLPRTNKELN